MMNIPIYRAKKIDRDEWVEGYFIPINPDRNNTIISIEVVGYEEFDGYIGNPDYAEVHHIIDPTTLAIHFPHWKKDMFASLNKDGIGASIMQEEDDEWIWLLSGDCSLTYKALNEFNYMNYGDEISVDDGKVIGIHKG